MTNPPIEAVNRYRKKPVEIEAVRYGGQENHTDAVKWLLMENANFDFSRSGLFILTLEGNMEVSPGDYIIKGIKGEFYPCKPDIFEATYDAIPGEST